jgi:hypothetical protein
MNKAALLGKASRGSAVYKRRAYLLYDEFTTDRAAGAVNGSASEPTGGLRTVTDTNGKITIANGVLSFATGLAVNDNVTWTTITRALGIAVISTINLADVTSKPNIGWSLDLFIFDNVAGARIYAAANGAAFPVVGTYTAATYQTAVILRTTGAFWFIKGGAFTNWTLMWNSLIGTIARAPRVATQIAASIFTVDNVRAPEQKFVPAPLQSDGMSAVTVDGLGNPEANSAAGASYVDIGTFGVAGGKRSCSALSGGLGFSYLATSSSNVILEAVCTRSAGVTGLVARYADDQNYLIAYHDGTNAKLDKVVAGTTTSLISAAAAYSATAVMSLHLDGTSARLFYNNAAVGTAATTPAAGALNHGVYTNDINATFDNLVIWPRGTEGQHTALDLL